MTEHPLIQLDLHSILRSRIGGWKGRLIPGFLISHLEKLIRQEDLNHLLRKAYPRRGSEFSEFILQYLDITLVVNGLENITRGESFIFASNHPLGGLDGIALVAILGKFFGDERLGVLVNDMLMNVEPLKDVFLPVNKYGAQGRKAAILLKKALEEGKQIVMFPAGLVSRLGDDGKIRDLVWQKSIVSKALEYDRKVIPVRFEALNSMKFYKFARRRLKSGLKINLEQSLLPSEIFSSRGKTFYISFGLPVNLRPLQDDGLSPANIAEKLRTLSNPD